MTPQRNMARVAELLAAVNTHPMCAKFEELGGKYRVIYPPGMILDGAQATHAGCGKSVALERLLAAMERHWRASSL